jgi:hemoglobin/transferrin/lactoferrin receptor protein
MYDYNTHYRKRIGSKMKQNKKLLLSLSLVTFIAINAMSNETTNLESIEVRDTAFESQVKSITSEVLDNRQASDIKDILKSIPSVVVDGNARYSQKVYVRGLEDKFSNITVDGAKITGELFHHSGDQTIDAEMLKIGSIELGANSALSGAGVVNGSFVYETKDPSDFLEKDEVFGGKISAGYQSAYERKMTSVAVFAKANDKLEFLGLGNISEDGDLHIANKKANKSKHSKLKSGLGKIVFKANDYNTIKFSYNKYQDGGNRNISGEKPGSNDEVYSYNEITRDTYTLNYEYNPDNDLVKLDAKIFSNSQKLNRDSFLDDNWEKDSNNNWIKNGKMLQPDRTYENKAVGFDLRNVSLLDTHMLTYGLDYTQEEQSKNASGLASIIGGTNDGNTVQSSVDGKGEIKAYGLYFEDEIDLDRLVLNLGLRYDIHEMGGFYSGKHKQLSPKFKASYKLNDNLNLRVGYGRIFKGPSLGETLTLSNSIVQNSDTKAQTGNNYELGLDYDLSLLLDANSSKIGFTAYTYNLDNYMHPTKNTSLKNQSDMNIWGLETVFNYYKNNTGFNISHTYSDGTEKDLSTSLKSEPRTAKIHTIKMGLDHKINNSLSINYNSELVPGNKYKYTSTKDVKRKGYGVHNLGATYKIAALKGTKINFGVDNIFDKKYIKHTAFGTYFGNNNYESEEVGRNFKVKLSYKF